MVSKVKGTEGIEFPDASVQSSAALNAFIGSNQSLTQNGYQKLPGGLIVQWGSIATTGDAVLTFHTEFSGLLSLSTSVEYSASVTGEAVICSVRAVNNQGFIAQARYINGTAGPAALPTTGNVRYIAIGY